MKILIGGSMSFADKMIEARWTLEQLGHEVKLSPDTDYFMQHAKDKMSFEEELKFCKETDIMRKFFDEIATIDWMLFLNYDRKWISWYIGTSVLMEIGIAFFLKKKIYLISPIDTTQSYALEVMETNPIIIDGDLNKIQ